MQGNRHSIRLRGHDYGSRGVYFVTLVAKKRRHLFGQIAHGRLVPTPLGAYVDECWLLIPRFYPHMAVDAWITMPDHFHGIVIIHRSAFADGQPMHALTAHAALSTRTLGSAIRGFKGAVTMWARANTAIVDVWQRNYYERILRDRRALDAVRRYIARNPGM